MISLKRLTLFNIDTFRKLYTNNENSDICNQNFFEVYDNETFIGKLFMRKQVKLFNFKKKIIGYVWYECPPEDELTNIYSLYVEENYIEYINSNVLRSLKSRHFRLDTIDSFRIKNIMNKLQFNPTSQTILMAIESKDYKIDDEFTNYTVRHFNKKQDEKLRCEIQNSVFNDKDRLPLSIGDIFAEEDEEYYIGDFSVFICNADGKEVGYGQIIYTNGQYTIVNLGILEEYRGQGYGEKLVKYLINLCNKENIPYVHIRVEKKNHKAISLYYKIGFREYNSFTTWFRGK